MMAEICWGAVSEKEATVSCYEPRSRAARRRRMEIRKFRFEPSETETETEQSKRQMIEVDEDKQNDKAAAQYDVAAPLNECVCKKVNGCQTPKYGFASVCGRRRDMEDAVDCKPSFASGDTESGSYSDLHYFGVFDGHGCSHVAMRCRDRMHAVLKDEIENREDVMCPIEWESLLKRSFKRMDQEVNDWNKSVLRNNCRCELQTPECDAVGSTAVVGVVTRDKIIVANCGDSRAVLSRGGKAVALSSDHKPDRPDELQRIEAAGGRVIYWDGPRVLGVLAMSRAIGDNYLKPYVIPEPEITITDRTAEDECLILASDGLWDVASNETACGVARMCLKGKGLKNSAWSGVEDGILDKGCSDASMLLTKLALARRSADNVSVVVVDLRKTEARL